MDEFFGSLIDGPLPNIFIIGGLVFLLLSVAGKIGALIITEHEKQKIAALIGVVLLISGLGLYLAPFLYTEQHPANDKPEPPNQIQLTHEFFSSRYFVFLHDEGEIISPHVRLEPSGVIRGIEHPNETRWGLEDNTLVFYHENGEPSTRFTDVYHEDVKLVFSGRLLLTPPHRVVIHVLKEK